MAISNVSSTNPLDQLAQSLVNRFDANKDGQLTTDEFTSFLSSFLSTVTPGAGAARGVSAGAPAVGLSMPKAPMAGFDAAKLADTTHTSLKYRFGRVAQRYGLSTVTSKDSAEALLTSMKSDLAAAGIDVLAVKGDKIQVKDDAGQAAWIDVIRGAGAGSGAAWQWLDTRY